MQELLLASQNPGKLEEMRLLASGLPFRVVGPREVGIREAPEETGTSFLENARIKALAYARLSGRLTVADDSGISVFALGGEPGLFSSRFGGEGASDRERNELLLSKLRGVPRERRGARFTSAVALARDAELLFEAEEHVEGLIAEEMRGANGFGYDPLFFYPPFGRTFGEVPRTEKDRVSHRGKAFARLREFLTGLGKDGGTGTAEPEPKTRSSPIVALEEAATEDLPNLLAWMQDFYAHEGIPFVAATSAATLRDLLDNPAFGRVFKLVADGTLVGYAALALGFSLEFGGRSAFLDELYVRPESRGRGIGAIALRLLQDEGRRLGAKSLALEVNLENAGAEALYRREGFTSIGRQLMTRRL